jgi:hypothetical protein
MMSIMIKHDSNHVLGITRIEKAPILKNIDA